MSWYRVPPRPATQWTGGEITPRAAAERIVDTRAHLVVPVAKEVRRRSETYRRFVASLPCAHCKRTGLSQAAHGDYGKGLALKSSDETCYPLCADAPGRRGCHSLIGASGTFSQEMRRRIESAYAALTKVTAIESGSWPKGWPL